MWWFYINIQIATTEIYRKRKIGNEQFLFLRLQFTREMQRKRIDRNEFICVCINVINQYQNMLLLFVAWCVRAIVWAYRIWHTHIHSSYLNSYGISNLCLHFISFNLFIFRFECCCYCSVLLASARKTCHHIQIHIYFVFNFYSF